jgi:hypothetical protein
MIRASLRFFFDHGAGGCLWAGDDATRAQLGLGPLDAATFRDGQPVAPPRLPLSDAARHLRDHLDALHARYLNPLYPPDPSLWSQALCDRFNADVDRLLALLRAELGGRYTIADEQPRCAEDARLGAYLAENPGLGVMDEVVGV